MAADIVRQKVLVVDDEVAIADLVLKLLESEGFSVQAAYSGRQALELMESCSFDLLILDVMMPEIDGFELCRIIRNRSSVPIIFLSAKEDESDKVIGLTLGGDDYISKPFKPRELSARVRSCLRRSSMPPVQAEPRVIKAKDIEIDLDVHRVCVKHCPLQLSPKEFDILVLLVQAKGKPLSAQEIYESLWSESFNEKAANSIMVHMRHLRQKLAEVGADTCIETVWGVGYKVRPE